MYAHYCPYKRGWGSQVDKGGMEGGITPLQAKNWHPPSLLEWRRLLISILIFYSIPIHKNHMCITNKLYGIHAILVTVFKANKGLPTSFYLYNYLYYLGIQLS